MKLRYLLSLILIFLLPLSTQAQEGEVNSWAQISFEQMVIDLGQIKQDEEEVYAFFKFANTGSSPLVILKVDSSCDCTKIKFTKKPIMPGEKSEISIKYDPKKASGTFLKAIQVYANTTESRHIVTLKGEVVE